MPQVSDNDSDRLSRVRAYHVVLLFLFVTFLSIKYYIWVNVLGDDAIGAEPFQVRINSPKLLSLYFRPNLERFGSQSSVSHGFFKKSLLLSLLFPITFAHFPAPYGNYPWCFLSFPLQKLGDDAMGAEPSSFG